jgi:hypothetical protein
MIVVVVLMRIMDVILTQVVVVMVVQEETTAAAVVVVTVQAARITTRVAGVAVHVPKSTTHSMNTMTCLKQLFAVARKVVEMIALAGMATVVVGEEIVVVHHLLLF